jgi:hypothetical protein
MRNKNWRQVQVIDLPVQGGYGGCLPHQDKYLIYPQVSRSVPLQG